MANLHKHTHVDDASFERTLDQLYSCMYCPLKFHSKTEAKNHSECHSMECSSCGENFRNPFVLGLHLAEHHNDGVVKVFCPLCSFSCSTASQLKKHIGRSHFDWKCESSDDESEISCKVCSLTFGTVRELRNHEKMHKNELTESLYSFNSLRKLYSCDTCLSEFLTENEVKIHVNEHTFSCPVCHAKFKKALLVGLHMAEHNKEGYVSCPLCNHSFTARCKSRLIRHIRQTHQKERPKTSQCEYCGSSYLSKTMLEDHIRVVHLRKEPYKCVVCGNTFTLQSSMRIHQTNKHRVVDESELSSNYCTLCKMTFKKPSSLMKHLEMKRCIPTPRVERQGHFVCDLCGKEFRFYKTFNLHLREHAGDKPYKCTYCPKSFVINSKRLAHEVSHTDARPFSCETCGQSYKTWKHLRRHLVVHGTDPKATFSCVLCGLVFNTKEAQRTHMKGCTAPKTT